MPECELGVLDVSSVQCIEYGQLGVYSIIPGSEYTIPNTYRSFQFVPVPGLGTGGLYPAWQLGEDPSEFYYVNPNQLALPFVFDATLSGYLTLENGQDSLAGEWMMYAHLAEDVGGTLWFCATDTVGIHLTFLAEGDTCLQTQTLPMWVSAQTSASGLNCDGSAVIQINAGTPPYTFSFTTGQSGSDSSLVNICPGAYGVTVVDATGAVASTNFVITSEFQVYGDSLISALLNPDTLFAEAIQNCDLDFSLPIDSFSVEGVLTIGSDTLVAQWEVWQAGVLFTVTTFYQNNPAGEPVLELTLYCMNGRSSIGSYQLFSTVSMRVTGTVLQNVANAMVSVYPNPNNGAFTLSSQTTANVQLQVLDAIGKEVLHMQISFPSHTQIDLLNQPSGLYFLHLKGADYSAVKRVVKY